MKRLLLFVLPSFVMSLHTQNAHAQACPNGDFENWNSRTYSEPDSMWYTTNPRTLEQADSLTVWPVTGFSGQAIHIQSAIVGTDSLQAFIANTPGNPISGQGGVPYTQQPTAITGYYRYNMVAGDSALLIAIFKKSGAVIAMNMFKISNSTGSLSTFTAFSLPLASLLVAPDSVIIAAASSNLSANVLHSGSWLELDQLEFTTSQPIPGGSFDNWLPDTLNTPMNWASGQAGQGGSGVSRSTLHYADNYSIELVSQPNGGGGGGNAVSPAQITTGTFPPNNGPTGGLPYTNTIDTLTGYYMYTPAGTDTAFIFVSLSHLGTPIGGNMKALVAASSWTYFSIPFSSTSVPDTMRIDVISSSFSAATPGSVLNLDYMQLKSQPLPPANVKSVIISNKVVAYPNPANDILNINCGNATGTVTAKIYDMVGKILDSKSYNVAPTIVTFSVGYLPAGIYLYEVTNNGETIRGEFSKQ